MSVINKGIGGRAMGELFNAVGLASILAAVGFFGISKEEIPLTSMILGIIGGVCVLVAGFNIMYNTKLENPSQRIKRAGYTKGIIFAVFAGLVAVAAAAISFAVPDMKALVLVFASISLLGWAAGEATNVAQQSFVIGESVAATSRVKAGADATFSGIKAVGIVVLVIGSIANSKVALNIGILITALGVIYNGMMGVMKLVAKAADNPAR